MMSGLLKDVPADIALEDLAPLSRLAAAERRVLTQDAEFCSLRAGEALFHEGANDTSAVFLLDGCVELRRGGRVVQRLSAGAMAANCALAEAQPRTLTAVAKSDVLIARISRPLMESVLRSDEERALREGSVVSGSAPFDWEEWSQNSPLIRELSAPAREQILERLDLQEVAEGQVIAAQGEAGDGYFILTEGCAEIVRSCGAHAARTRLALLGPGASFGEEALASGAPRNASMRMLSAGTVARLSPADFDELILRSLVRPLDIREATALCDQGCARWLDIRSPDELTVARGFTDALHHPLVTLRTRAERLDGTVTYIAYCNNGRRSRTAALLLAERGLAARFLEGGLEGLRPIRTEVETDLSLSCDEERSTPRIAGPVLTPTSHRCAEDSEIRPCISETPSAERSGPMRGPAERVPRAPSGAFSLPLPKETPSYSTESEHAHGLEDKVSDESDSRPAESPHRYERLAAQLAASKRELLALSERAVAERKQWAREREAYLKVIEQLRSSMERRIDADRRRARASLAAQTGELRVLRETEACLARVSADASEHP